MAISGAAASTKLGRRPFVASPYSVNCETTSTAPPTSASARFILPSASPNTRRPSSVSAIHASVPSTSVGANPARTRNPTPIFPVTRPLTRTSARETRCTTTLTPPRTARLRIADLRLRIGNPRVESAIRNPQSAIASLHRHTFCQVARLVHVAAPPHGDVVGEQLQGQHREHQRQQIERLGNLDRLVGELRDP